MYFQTALIAAAASLFALPAIAQITPTSPSGSTVVNAGSDIQALWNSDTSGQWTDVEIQLMTGDNLQVSFRPSDKASASRWGVGAGVDLMRLVLMVDGSSCRYVLLYP